MHKNMKKLFLFPHSVCLKFPCDSRGGFGFALLKGREVSNF